MAARSVGADQTPGVLDDQLIDDLDILKKDAYDQGWMLKIRMEKPSEAEALLEDGGYQKVVDAQSGRQEREVGPGVLVHIPPDVYHSTVCTSDEEMVLLAVYAPPGPEAQLRAMDGVRIEPPTRA